MKVYHQNVCEKQCTILYSLQPGQKCVGMLKHGCVGVPECDYYCESPFDVTICLRCYSAIKHTLPHPYCLPYFHITPFWLSDTFAPSVCVNSRTKNDVYNKISDNQTPQGTKTQNIPYIVYPNNQQLRELLHVLDDLSRRHPDEGNKPAGEWQSLLSQDWLIILGTAWASHPINTGRFTVPWLRMKVLAGSFQMKHGFRSAINPS